MRGAAASITAQRRLGRIGPNTLGKRLRQAEHAVHKTCDRDKGGQEGGRVGAVGGCGGWVGVVGGWVGWMGGWVGVVWWVGVVGGWVEDSSEHHWGNGGMHASVGPADGALAEGRPPAQL